MPPSTPSFGPFLTRERLALGHAALLVIASSWLFGGIGPRFEWIVAGLAAPAFALLFAEGRARLREPDRAGFFRLLRWASPLAALAAYVITSALNPSHRPAFIYDGQVLRPVPHLAWLPSSVTPTDSLRLLACFGGLAASGLALAFCVHSRRALRGLVLVLALNSLALAVLGTLQRQGGATGPYFGALIPQNPSWFATFLYHNHWGAFAVLHAAATLGLVFHSLRHPPDRGWLHGPGPLLVLAALLLAATAPLSTSRSATALMLFLGLAASLAVLRHTLRSARRGRSPSLAIPRLAGLAAAFALVATLIVFQSREILAARLALTRTQIAELQAGTVPYTRGDLYADTWRMAAERPLFGWGLEAYGPIFVRFSSIEADPHGMINTFEDAHSDWLQSIAEIGFLGTTLLLAVALLPLVETLRPSRLSPLPAWLLGGSALIAAYAWVEFPLANPAVVAAWWVFWFAGLRSLQLSSNPSA